MDTERHSPWAFALPISALALLFLLVLLGTRSTFFADTDVYVANVASVLEHHQPLTSLLEFGHLIWRPLGAYMTHPSGAGGGDVLRRQIAMNLIHFNFVASAVCAVAMWILMRLVRGVSVSAALLSCSAFLATNGFIVLSRTGSAYMPGLGCLLVACCCALQASKRNSLQLAVWAAVFTAASVMFWVPYVLSAATVACACLLSWEEGNQGKRLMKSAIRILPVAGLLTMIAFAIAAYASHIGTSAEFWEWVRSAAQGPRGDRQWLRVFFGLPRSFFIMGDDGVLWKQFLFRDPYAGVGLWDVLRASAWKIALFYAVMGATALELIRKAPQRWILLWAATAVLPTLALAVAFEAGSVERYLALYPAVFVAFACVLSQRPARAARALVAFFCGVLIVSNLWASLTPVVDRQRANSLARLATVQTGNKADVGALAVYVLNARDDIATLYDPNDRSLDSIPPVRPLIPTLAIQIPNWRGMFAQTVLQTWNRGGEVWVSKRAWADRPRREWSWVEGDDRRVHWKDLGAVLSRFKIDVEVGGLDGFNRVADTPENRAAATALGEGSLR
jgi:hypothetical protein